jgi:hypothetical protein
MPVNVGLARVLKLRGVGRDVDGLALLTTDFKPRNVASITSAGRTLKVVPVRRWTAAWWDVHIDGETPRCVFRQERS